MGCDIHLIAEQWDSSGEWHRVPHFDHQCDYCEGSGTKNGKECFYCLGVGHRIERHYHRRNYDVFAMLANVRNGYGFAGTLTGSGFKPLSDARGLPADLGSEQRFNLTRSGYQFVPDGAPIYDASLDTDEEDATYDWKDPDNEKNEWAYNLGDHSWTWVGLDELADADYWRNVTTKSGWVSAEQYAVYQREGEPQAWSGGISGGNIKHVSNDEMRTLIKYGRARDCYTEVEWQQTYADAAEYFLSRIAEMVDHIGNPEPGSVRLVMGFDS